MGVLSCDATARELTISNEILDSAQGVSETQPEGLLSTPPLLNQLSSLEFLHRQSVRQGLGMGE